MSPPRLRYARPPQHEAYSIRCRFCDSCAGKKYLMPDPGGATVSLPKAVQESGGSFRVPAILQQWEILLWDRAPEDEAAWHRRCD